MTEYFKITSEPSTVFIKIKKAGKDVTIVKIPTLEMKGRRFDYGVYKMKWKTYQSNYLKIIKTNPRYYSIDEKIFNDIFNKTVIHLIHS